MRKTILLAVLGLLAGCARPPASAYEHGRLGATAATHQIAIGKNAVGEACTLQNTGGDTARGANVYCGTWQQPSAVIHEGGASGAGTLGALATASPWRAGLDQRFLCQAPQATTILGGDPAELLNCTQRVGGWPHVALVALVDGHAWYADGVLPAAPAMQRAIGVRAGVLSATAAPASSAADALLAQRLAAQAFSSGDVGQYNALMSAGTLANLADDPGAAESAFRAALALQRKALGHDNPNTVTALTTLAMQLSDEGRFVEAAGMFDRAATLAPRAADPTADARLLNYRGLDAMNQGRYADALKLLGQSATAYSALVPARVLAAQDQGLQPLRAFGVRGAETLSSLLPNQDLLTDPAAQSALLGLIEVRRNQSLALRHLGSLKEAEAKLRSAELLARANGLARPIVAARLLRSSATTAGAAGRTDAELTDLAQSAEAFGVALPGSKPFADTNLLRADALVRGGDPAAALGACQAAVHTLLALHAGTRPELMEPCLDAYAAAAKGADPAARQGLLGEMFTAAQLAQGSITSEQIAEATARLRENARDPKVAKAIRARQDAGETLRQLYRERSAASAALAPAAKPSPELAAIDKKIDAARTAQAEAETAVQAASPNFGQLVQQVVTARQVFAALRPHEGFVQISLGVKHGWTFLLRHRGIAVARVPTGLGGAAKLVGAVRAGIELTTTALPVFNIDAARGLYADTLGGVAKDMTGMTALVVAPAGPLLSLPFEVLLTGPAQADKLADAPWLLRRFTIAHVPAASNFVSLRKIAGTSRARQPWFGFGDFQPLSLSAAEASFPGQACGDTARLLSGLPALPYADKELAAARQILGANSGDELLGPAFTAPAVLRLKLSDYRILHFATHALLPAELRCQSQPAIVTSDPAGARTITHALLTASDVMGMHLDANLVILSACNSGGGQTGGATGGESLSGLARAFFFAGARALMVTHWSVNDQVTAYLIADTLHRLRADPALGIAGAMRNAQLAMLRDAGHALPPEVAHPFFWAPFAVIGDGGAQSGAVATRGAARRVAALR